VVTLSGKAKSLAQKIHAERAVGKVAGVKAVAEDLIVNPAKAFERSDTEIALSVANVLEWNTAVPREGIFVKVENGIVSLDGHVDWEFQRKAAIKAVSHLAGVKMVNSMIKVSPKISIVDVRSEISSALHRSATLNSENIAVIVDGSRVTLQGKVNSHAVRKEAEEAAWNASGVTHVDCLIDVESAGYS
jgi:osmotically-inducible protein OsmY